MTTFHLIVTNIFSGVSQPFVFHSDIQTFLSELGQIKVLVLHEVTHS